ncbi:unnamed protein product [Lathyrus oleraceus]
MQGSTKRLRFSHSSHLQSSLFPHVGSLQITHTQAEFHSCGRRKNVEEGRIHKFKNSSVRSLSLSVLHRYQYHGAVFGNKDQNPNDGDFDYSIGAPDFKN